jgi:hypothetical protein
MSLAGAAVLLIFVIQQAPKMVIESRHEKPKEIIKVEDKKAKLSDAPVPVPASTLSAQLEIKTDSNHREMEKAVPTAQVFKSVEKSPSLGAPASLNVAVEAPGADIALSSKITIHERDKNVDNQIISGISSGITQPLEKVISDRKTWEEYWNRHQKGSNEKGPLPEIDFEKNEIIALFAGNQPTAGFRVEITRVLLTQWENAPARVVRYRVSGPPEGVMAATVVTQPFCFKIVPKAAGATFFRKIR